MVKNTKMELCLCWNSFTHFLNRVFSALCCSLIPYTMSLFQQFQSSYLFVKLFTYSFCLTKPINELWNCLNSVQSVLCSFLMHHSVKTCQNFQSSSLKWFSNSDNLLNWTVFYLKKLTPQVQWLKVYNDHQNNDIFKTANLFQRLYNKRTRIWKEFWLHF